MADIDLIKLLERKEFWSKITPYNDTVLSTRIRLIRNVYDIPFSHRQNKNHTDFIKSIAHRFVRESRYKDLELIEIDTMDDTNKRFLLERNLISQRMTSNNNCYIILSRDEDFSIMINDMDHFKIQVIKPGFQTFEAFDLADEVDNQLNKFAIYAFSEDTGYITSYLTSVPDFQASTMLHLPVLYHIKEIMEIQKQAELNRLIFKGIRGDGLKTFGSVFILSNEYIPEIPETGIIDILERTTYNIINIESNLREDYFAENGHLLEDRICRSYGTLKYARRIGYLESMHCLSDIRLGIILSIVKNIELQRVNDLMVNMQWSHLQKIANKEFNNSADSDIFRASYIRDQFEWSVLYG